MARRKSGRLPVWFALLSMFLQVVFSAEHASASAAATAMGGSAGLPVGFLQICTAEGLVRLSPPGDNESGSGAKGGEACAICGVAAVSGAAEIPLPVLPAALTDYVHLIFVPAPAAAVQWAAPPAAYSSRAPPVRQIFPV
ncbi:MAG: hypothetical protein C0605_00235 [Hyphomicrobiales bacterium]|nr:MAG: hypothetical protein C0605_00235 [Hyphomicrobiales bacterium]